MLSKHPIGQKHVISGDYLTHLRNFAVEQNVPMEVLLHGVSLTPKQLLNPPQFVDDVDFNTVTANLFAHLPQPFLKAVELAKGMSFSVHGALGVALQGAKNLEQMLLLAQKYYRSRASNSQLLLEKHQGYLHVVPESKYLYRSPYLALTILFSFKQQISVKLKKYQLEGDCHIHISSPLPDYITTDWQETFKVSFGQHRDELLVPQHWLELPIDTIDFNFARLAELQCVETLASLTSNDVKTIVTDLLKQGPTNMLNIKAVARELCMSPSSLQRRLKEENITFKALKHGIIIEEAKRLLQEGNKVEEIAEYLGFNDASSFSKSFKAAEGITPGEFKRV